MRIGIVGSGNIGATVGQLWVESGHRVRFSSRHPNDVEALVARLGPSASLGDIRSAIAFGDVLFFATPLGAWPALAATYGSALDDRVVIDASNPYAQRDGAVVAEVDRLGRGAGGYVAELLPRMRLVRAFNTIFYVTLGKEAHRPGERIAIPVASSDASALELACTLVRDAGFDAVPLDGILEARRFDPGAHAYGSPFVRLELEARLAAELSHHSTRSDA